MESITYRPVPKGWQQSPIGVALMAGSTDLRSSVGKQSRSPAPDRKRSHIASFDPVGLVARLTPLARDRIAGFLWSGKDYTKDREHLEVASAALKEIIAVAPNA